MDLSGSLAPRDRSAAARIGGILTWIAALITAIFAVIQMPPGGTAVHIAVFAVPAGLVVLAAGFRRAATSWPDYIWVLFPVVGVVAVAGLDIVTSDASAAGQVFLCYPVLYAASQLRPLGAAITGVVAVVGDAVVVFTLQPLAGAINDFSYVTATLVTMIVLLVRAGEAQSRLVGRLRAQAAIDPLTGLVTRRVLMDAAELAVGSAGEDAGTALILLDIDKFKAINDTHGHPIGDAVLVHLAAILVAHSRPGSVTCRMGGDELAILLPGCSSDAAVRRAEQFLEAIRSTPLELSDGTLLAVSVSMGVAHLPTHAHTLDDLYQAADAALYATKRGGRAGVGLAPTPSR